MLSQQCWPVDDSNPRCNLSWKWNQNGVIFFTKFMKYFLETLHYLVPYSIYISVMLESTQITYVASRYVEKGEFKSPS